MEGNIAFTMTYLMLTVRSSIYASATVAVHKANFFSDPQRDLMQCQVCFN